MLGQNFAKAFDVKFTDENGESKYCWQTCYGPAISRIYAALIATHGDEKGLVLPFELAPIQIVIVPIIKAGNEKKVMKKCKGIEKLLVEKFKIKLDDSENTPGFKYNYWEMKGVPVRLEIGERDIEAKSVMLFRRDTKEKKKIAEKDLGKTIEKVAKEMQKNLVDKADEWFGKQVGKVNRMEELKSALDRQGFVRVPFCTDSMEGKECAEKVKEATHANMRGSLFGSKEKPKAEKCVACGKEAEVYLYAARQY